MKIKFNLPIFVSHKRIAMAEEGKHIITANEILSLYEDRKRYIALANRYVKDSSTAEEIVHQCIFSLMADRDGKYVLDLRAFFAFVIKNRTIDYLRRKSKECSTDGDISLKRRIDTEIGCLTAHPDMDGPLADFPELLKKARGLMPELTYDVFMAKRLDRMSYKEIGEVFRISESRIHYEINRAVKIFRKVFRDYGIFAVLLFGGIMMAFS